MAGLPRAFLLGCALRLDPRQRRHEVGDQGQECPETGVRGRNPPDDHEGATPDTRPTHPALSAPLSASAIQHSPVPAGGLRAFVASISIEGPPIRAIRDSESLNHQPSTLNRFGSFPLISVHFGAFSAIFNRLGPTHKIVTIFHWIPDRLIVTALPSFHNPAGTNSGQIPPPRSDLMTPPRTSSQPRHP